MRRHASYLVVCLVVTSHGCGDSHVRGTDPVDVPDLPIRSEHDTDCDGTIDQCTVYTQVGEETTWGVDDDCDGVADHDCVTQRGDEFGISANIRDDNCDGMPDGSNCIDSFIDEHGHGISKRDDDCDGAPEHCSDTTYDDRGRSLAVSSSVDCVGSPTVCVTYTYDSSGAAHKSKDNGCDGTIDEVTCRTIIRDAESRIIGDSSDNNCDGIPDSFCKETTYGHGLELSTTTDGDCDGVLDLCRSSIITGLTITVGLDPDCDGIPDTSCTVTTFDAQDHILTEASDVDCDGPTAETHCWTVTYDDTGRSMGRSFDEDCADAPDWCETSVYAD